MATAKKNKMSPVPEFFRGSVCVIAAEWNKDITEKLVKGAVKVLNKSKFVSYDVRWVPGALELPMAAKIVATNGEYDAIIAIGCVVRGDTSHFDYVCRGAFDGLMRVQLEHELPITFGILTTENFEQAAERAGGKLGNKGSEAAEAALKMAQFHDDIIVEFDENWDEDFDDEEDDDFEDDDFEDDEDDILPKYITDDKLLN